jgi:hypothetical protein
MTRVRMTLGLVAVFACALACAGGCGDDDVAGSIQEPDSGAAGDAQAAEDGSQAAESTAIAVLMRTCGPDDCLSYLNVYESVDAMKEAGKVDKSASVELPYSQGRAYAGSIYLFSRGEQPEVTRWNVADDLSVREEDTVSFANTGTQVFCEICNVFGSEELAFHLDGTGGVTVAWNPTTMEIVERSDIAESLLTRFEGDAADIVFPRAFGGRAYFNVSWSNSETPEIYERAAVVTFDVTDPTPELQVIEDERCGGTWAMSPFEDRNGNVYVMGEWSGGFYQVGILEPKTTPACLLRLEPGADAFDPDYHVDLLTVLDAQAIRNAFAMADRHLLLNYLPTDAPKLSEDAILADPYAYYAVTDFQYAVLDLETLTVTPVASLPPTRGGSATPLSIDDRTFIQIYDDEETATLYEVKTDGSTEKILEATSGSDFDMIGRVR